MKRSRTRAAGGSCAPARAGYTLAMRRLLSPLSLALLALSLAACGNKGPLVLPDKPVPAGTSDRPAAEQPAGDAAGTRATQR